MTTTTAEDISLELRIPRRTDKAIVIRAAARFLLAEMSGIKSTTTNDNKKKHSPDHADDAVRIGTLLWKVGTNHSFPTEWQPSKPYRHATMMGICHCSNEKCQNQLCGFQLARPCTKHNP